MSSHSKEYAYEKDTFCSIKNIAGMLYSAYFNEDYLVSYLLVKRFTS